MLFLKKDRLSDRVGMEDMLTGMAMPCCVYAGKADPAFAQTRSASEQIPNAPLLHVRRRGNAVEQQQISQQGPREGLEVKGDDLPGLSHLQAFVANKHHEIETTVQEVVRSL
jgi:hypothetical protein